MIADLNEPEHHIPLLKPGTCRCWFSLKKSLPLKTAREEKGQSAFVTESYPSPSTKETERQPSQPG